MRSTNESEIAYLFPKQSMDRPSRWASESGYFRGLGEDGGESVLPAAPATDKTWYEKLVESLVPTAAAVYQARELNKLNLQRVQQGLPMLSAQQFAQTYQPPVATVQVGMTPQTKQMLMFGALGIAALVGLRAAKII